MCVDLGETVNYGLADRGSFFPLPARWPTTARWGDGAWHSSPLGSMNEAVTSCTSRLANAPTRWCRVWSSLVCDGLLLSLSLPSPCHPPRCTAMEERRKGNSDEEESV